jgi:hypothetical protein
MNLDAFRASLTQSSPPDASPPALRALWHEARQDWTRAHNIVQEADDRDCAWVHAYLHRVEGDLSNAGYWYRRARQPVCEQSLNEEWEAIVSSLLSGAAAS